ncbi:uncharacterized protein MKZ38_000960 [Zalerion maritima]|uniref:UBC core domain-containing protein n=1 Tax=Zalerion maritima TaxID=339359 RepID=A0AAD5RS07_9PEZI|nr:uncharacterized protein MKZ38_000960 [Zalerion maritima]
MVDLDSGNDRKSSSNNDGIHTRLVTLDRAFREQSLANIDPYPEPFERSTTLPELLRAISDIIFESYGMVSDFYHPQVSEVELYLEECLVLIGDDDVRTLADLGLSGTFSDPLTIYIAFALGDGAGTTNPFTNPELQLGIRVSACALNTFYSCLGILSNRLRRGTISINRVQNQLVHYTHFPPVAHILDALRLNEFRELSLGSVCMLAEAFALLCEKVVPRTYWKTPYDRLNSARQICFWIESQCSEPNANSEPCIFGAQRFPWRSLEDANARAVFKTVRQVYLQPSTCDSSTSRDLGQVDGFASCPMAISLEIDKAGLAEKLAAILGNGVSPSTTSFHCFFFAGEGLRSAKPRPWEAQGDGIPDFDVLLEDANRSTAFAMIDPAKIETIYSAQLPVLTLDGAGNVSIYDQDDVDCGDREFYIYNPVHGKRPWRTGTCLGERLVSSPAFAKYIDVALDNDTWVLQCWAGWDVTAFHGAPEESIVICVDTSGSMSESMPKSWCRQRDGKGHPLTKLDEVKQFFHQFSTRLSSEAKCHRVGLVQFSSQVKMVQPLTQIQPRFRNGLADMGVGGATSMHDALDTAANMLMEEMDAFPRSRRRIIVLTDGRDNSSHKGAPNVAFKLRDVGILLDALVLPPARTDDLFKVCRITGGYAFAPPSQDVFFQVLLLETMLDISLRPQIRKTMVPRDWICFKPKENEMKDAFSVPPCRPHPNSADFFVDLSLASKYMARATDREEHSTHTTTSTSKSPPATVSKILLNEISNMVVKPHPYMDVYVSESRMSFWKVVMQGPPESPYEKGTFELQVEIGSEFPRSPPKIKFITPLQHPNIGRHGRICHPMFDREWSPNMSVRQMMEQIYGMLMYLEARETLDTVMTMNFYTDPAEALAKVNEFIERFAWQTRQELREEILGLDQEQEQETESTLPLPPPILSTTLKTPERTTHDDQTAKHPLPPSDRADRGKDHSQKTRRAEDSKATCSRKRAFSSSLRTVKEREFFAKVLRLEGITSPRDTVPTASGERRSSEPAQEQID